jgi:2-methylcitrate dehydratase PrpD
MSETVARQRVPVTQAFCTHVAKLTPDDLPAPALHAGRRGVLDWLGCALAGANHPTLDHLIAVLQEVGGRAQATVFARCLRLGLLEAPLANGQAAHVLDYDDTHMGGVVLHASSPVLAALFALAERQAVSGAAFLLAYAVGFEAGVRTGQTAPGHHKGGWHLTGTLGSVAAAVAGGKLLGLDATRLTHAMGIGATQAAGMQQNRGTMCKSLHAGKAAANGVLAALLAERGFDSSTEIVEGQRGYCRIYSDVATPEALLDELGSRWEIMRNGHKPYACGVVLHPVIDAVIALRRAHGIDPAAVDAIEMRVHPLVLEITGVQEPATGLQSKFSVYHSAAVALLDGAAGIPQYRDERALDPAVIALRRKVVATTDETLGKDQAEAVLVAKGARHRAFVPHATGTTDNPMSDAAIEAKFLSNAEPVIGADRAGKVRDLVWGLERVPDMRAVIALLV